MDLQTLLKDANTPFVGRLVSGMVGASLLGVFTLWKANKDIGWGPLVRLIMRPHLVVGTLLGGFFVAILINPTDFTGGVVSGLTWETSFEAFLAKAGQTPTGTQKPGDPAHHAN